MERSRHLLMLGPDYLAMDVALGLGIEVTLVIGGGVREWGTPLPDGVGVLVVDDHRNVESTMGALVRAGLDGASLDAVYTHDDRSMMNAAAVGALLGVRAVSASEATLFRDKYLQKKRLAEHGVPVAAHHVIEDIREIPAGYAMPFERGVVKPVAGTATESTYVVEGIDDLRRVSRECRVGNVPTRCFVLEEFVDGVEWFADGVVRDGEVVFFSLGRYAQNCLAAINEARPVRTIIMDPTADRVSYDLARPLVADALRALDLRDGVFHMEMFHDEATNAVVFSECAARRGGGPIRDEVLYKFGVDLAECAIREALGDPVDVAVRVRDGVVASTYLPVPSGTVLSYPSAAEIVARPDVVHTRIYLPPGYRHAAGAAKTTYGRLADVTVHAVDHETAIARLDELTVWFTDRTETWPVSPTFRELWDHPRNAGFVDTAGDLAAR